MLGQQFETRGLSVGDIRQKGSFSEKTRKKGSNNKNKKNFGKFSVHGLGHIF